MTIRYRARGTIFQIFVSFQFFLLVFGQCLFAQTPISEKERSRNREILWTIKEEIAKNYFDKTFRGVDLEAKFKQADELLKKATSNSESFFTIAAFVNVLDDSHTRFSPPTRSVKYEHGWKMRMIGEKCFVVEVEPNSDAEKKGLREGDQILSIEGFQPTRNDFSNIKYVLYSLNPLPDFNLIVQTPAGERKKVLVSAKRTEGMKITDLTSYNEYLKEVRDSENRERMNAHRFVDLNDDVTIWKMPHFDLAAYRVDDLVDKVRKKKALILDLRGNGGGYEETLMRLIGNVMGKDVRIGDLIQRKESKPWIARSVGNKAFNGKLVVLIDSDSFSSSEIFARVVQMQQRGTIVGDTSGGKVMRSLFYPKQYGLDIAVFYGVSITDSDTVMSDGSRLEKIGVTPDTIHLPSASDLAAKRDPVLAYAAKLVGVEITPEKAGSLFPVIWK